MGSPLRTLSSSLFLFSSFCTFLVPKFFGCIELSITPVLFHVHTTAAVHVDARPCPQPQSSLCTSCYLKPQDFYKNVILYEDKRFCSTLYRSSAPPWTYNVADPKPPTVGLQTLLFSSFLSSVNELSSVRLSVHPSIPGQCDWERSALSKAVHSALKAGHCLCQRNPLLTNDRATSVLQRRTTTTRLFVACGNDNQTCSLNAVV